MVQFNAAGLESTFVERLKQAHDSKHLLNQGIVQVNSLAENVNKRGEVAKRSGLLLGDTYLKAKEEVDRQVASISTPLAVTTHLTQYPQPHTTSTVNHQELWQPQQVVNYNPGYVVAQPSAVQHQQGRLAQELEQYGTLPEHQAFAEQEHTVAPASRSQNDFFEGFAAAGLHKKPNPREYGVDVSAGIGYRAKHAFYGTPKDQQKKFLFDTMDIADTAEKIKNNVGSKTLKQLQSNIKELDKALEDLQTARNSVDRKLITRNPKELEKQDPKKAINSTQNYTNEINYNEAVEDYVNDIRNEAIEHQNNKTGTDIKLGEAFNSAGKVFAAGTVVSGLGFALFGKGFFGKAMKMTGVASGITLGGTLIPKTLREAANIDYSFFNGLTYGDNVTQNAKDSARDLFTDWAPDAWQPTKLGGDTKKARIARTLTRSNANWNNSSELRNKLADELEELVDKRSKGWAPKNLAFNEGGKRSPFVRAKNLPGAEALNLEIEKLREGKLVREQKMDQNNRPELDTAGNPIYDEHRIALSNPETLATISTIEGMMDKQYKKAYKAGHLSKAAKEASQNAGTANPNRQIDAEIRAHKFRNHLGQYQSLHTPYMTAQELKDSLS